MKKKIIINGKEYDNLNDIPNFLNNILEDKNNNGMPDIVEDALQNKNLYINTQKFVVKGKEYNSLDEMPEDVRQYVQEKLQKLGNQNVNWNNIKFDVNTFTNNNIPSGNYQINNIPHSNRSGGIPYKYIFLGIGLLAVIVEVVILIFKHFIDK